MQIGSEFGDYAESYRKAAATLFRSAKNTSVLGNQLAFPMLYLYRHALELALKDANVWTEMTLAAAPAVLPAKTIDEVRAEVRGHQLRPLMDRLANRFALLDANFGARDLGDLERAVGPAVAVLDALDADGQRLRYPFVTRTLAPSWSEDRRGPTLTEMLVVRDEVEAALAHLLDVMGSWFSTVMDRAIEEAWLAELWEAEERCLKVEELWNISAQRLNAGVFNPGGWSNDLVDETMSDMSAELLDDRDDL
jgi:hypothetical protein